MAKKMIDITGEDVQMECLANQLALSVTSGVKGAIHAFDDLFHAHAAYAWGLLLVDASCTFNVMSTSAAV